MTKRGTWNKSDQDPKRGRWYNVPFLFAILVLLPGVFAFIAIYTAGYALIFGESPW